MKLKQGKKVVVNVDTLSEHSMEEEPSKTFMDEDVEAPLKRKTAQASVVHIGRRTKHVKTMGALVDEHVADSPHAPPVIQRKLPHWPQRHHPTLPVRYMQPTIQTQAHDQHTAAMSYSEVMRSLPLAPPPVWARGTFPGVYQFFGSANNTTTTQQPQEHHQHYQHYHQPASTAPPVSMRGGMFRQPFVLNRGTYVPTYNVDMTSSQQYTHHQQQQQQQHQTNYGSSGPLPSVSRHGMVSHQPLFVPRPLPPFLNDAAIPSQFALDGQPQNGISVVPMDPQSSEYL
jgi:hypothetical protein